MVVFKVEPANFNRYKFNPDSAPSRLELRLLGKNCALLDKGVKDFIDTEYLPLAATNYITTQLNSSTISVSQTQFKVLYGPIRPNT